MFSDRARLGVAVMLLLAGCAGSGGPLLNQYMEEESAIVVTGLSDPLILSREEPGRAANARDYIYLGPVELNRMGARSRYLWFAIWSMVDGQEISREDFERVQLIVDGEPLELTLAAWNPDAARLTTYARPVRSASEAYYPVTVDQLERLAVAREIRLEADGNGSYAPWRWNAGAVSEFADFARTGIVYR